MTATMTRPAPRVTTEMLAAQWERLGHWYNHGPIDDAPVWRAVDALAAGLPEAERTLWFEQLYQALAELDEPAELLAVPPVERDPDPDLFERDITARIEDAVERLIGGAR